MSNSILTSTKKMIGITEDYTAFDLDILMHINSALATVSQLGVGPSQGFMVEDATATWSQLLGPDLRLNFVRQYVALKVRLAFDPPQTSFVINAIEAQIKELEWRINVQRETLSWVDPNPDFSAEESDFVLDGGGP